MFGLALGQSFSHQMQSMVRNESFTRQLNVLRGKPLFLGPRGPLVLPPVDPSVRKKLRPFYVGHFVLKVPLQCGQFSTAWLRGVNSCPDDLEHFYIKKNSVLQRSAPGCPSEVEFVHTVTAGSSVKFLPAV